MTSVRLAPATRDAMRAWSARHGRPSVYLALDAIDLICADPAAALTLARPYLGPAVRGNPMPLVSHAERWAAARTALEQHTGPGVQVGRVIRALIEHQLAIDPTAQATTPPVVTDNPVEG